MGKSLIRDREETKFLANKHKIMWLWIADQTLKRKKCITKQDYFDEHEILPKYSPKNLCYACEEALKVFNETSSFWRGESICPYCPLAFSNYVCQQFNSLYNRWNNFVNINDYENAAIIAKKIANSSWLDSGGDTI